METAQKCLKTIRIFIVGRVSSSSWREHKRAIIVRLSITTSNNTFRGDREKRRRGRRKKERKKEEKKNGKENEKEKRRNPLSFSSLTITLLISTRLDYVNYASLSIDAPDTHDRSSDRARSKLLEREGRKEGKK